MFEIGEFTEIGKLVVPKGYKEARKNQGVTANGHRILPGVIKHYDIMRW